MSITAIKLGATLPLLMSPKGSPPDKCHRQVPTRLQNMNVQIVQSLTIPFFINPTVSTCDDVTEESPKGFSPSIEIQE